MSEGVQQFYAYFTLGVLALIGYGGWGLVTNNDAFTYEVANKEQVPATVTSLTVVGFKPEQCQVVMDVSGNSVTVLTDDLNPCEQLNDSPLKPGAAVQLEYWNNKPTAIYLGQSSWPTQYNPGHSAALSATALFFGVLLGIVLVAIAAIHFAIWYFFGRRPDKRWAKP